VDFQNKIQKKKSEVGVLCWLYYKLAAFLLSSLPFIQQENNSVWLDDTLGHPMPRPDDLVDRARSGQTKTKN
jgi:hypothetical protein